MFKRVLLLRISHYMFRLPIKPSSGVSKHRIIKVAVTDPLLKLIKRDILVRSNKARLNIVVKEGFITYLLIVTHAAGCIRP
jgi:hypothetical protein